MLKEEDIYIYINIAQKWRDVQNVLLDYHVFSGVPGRALGIIRFASVLPEGCPVLVHGLGGT